MWKRFSFETTDNIQKGKIILLRNIHAKLI